MAKLLSNKVLREKVARLNKIATDYNGRDAEVGHLLADDVLCDILYQMGYKGLVEAYRAVEKNYD